MYCANNSNKESTHITQCKNKCIDHNHNLLDFHQNHPHLIHRSNYGLNHSHLNKLPIFGLKLIEKAHNKTVQYLLINGLINKLDLNVEQKAKLESEKMILLLIILCAIYKSGSRLKEENLLEFLKNADFIVDVKKPVKGKGRFKDLDVVKFLRQELTGMSYLVCTELEMECEEKTYEYKWGERAKNEVSYDKIEKLYESIDSVELEENMMIDGDGDNNYYFGDVMITDK
ncbi:uncharacterized protein LOC142328815 isoform X3 [Lycorma delicatula]|uniref:uncharacterized protein LOC142328815 isoform X3 n=1 Tax=Lycorma delicatula TaxID=130591 RepID=UPI003F512ADF